jgi:hypothetical protein
LLQLQSGAPVADAAQWELRRTELIRLALDTVYGALPPAPLNTQAVLLHEAALKPLDGARIQSLQIQTDGHHAFNLRLLLPASQVPTGVVVCGDACWAYVNDTVQMAVLQSGYALALFNRTEVMADLEVPGGMDCASAAHIQPRCIALRDYRGAAIAAWAWGYHRVVDVLQGLTRIDPLRVAVVGHSRGGKAALLAGALDMRIALTSANNSGLGGAGCLRYPMPGAETVKDLTRAFPHWLTPSLKDYADKAHTLPFDAHMLKALIAPRWLLTTEASGDLWANPQGSHASHLAAHEVFQFLNAPQHIQEVVRSGGHAHTLEDWKALIQAMKQGLR